MNANKKEKKISAASFRDPSGFVFFQEGRVYRQINKSFKDEYEKFMSSGLYQSLVQKKLLVPHEEIYLNTENNPLYYKTIKPKKINFISYPYEWCFSQLKDAALITLKIQKEALKYNFTLKDASAYNIQFHQGRAIFIDTLSFASYQEGEPWVAYRQFCEHFLAPLALAVYSDIRLFSLLRTHIDGVPLDMTSKILPLKTWLKFGLLSHVHLHSRSQNKFSNKTNKKFNATISKKNLLALLNNLEMQIKKLKWRPTKTVWRDYYQKTNYTTKDRQRKKEIINESIKYVRPTELWDLGANTGEYSHLASNLKINTLALDFDYSAVETAYLKNRRLLDKFFLPLVLDLGNPSPGLGWAHSERDSLLKRGPTDMLMALALVHHLAITHNLPFNKIADYFSRLGKYLLIEFIPKEDSNAQRLLASRDDIFINYSQANFEKDFNKHFNIINIYNLPSSKRVLYLMKNKSYE